MQRPKSPKKFAPLIIDTTSGEKPSAPAKTFQLQINEEPVSQAPQPAETPSFQSKRPQRMIFDEAKINEIKESNDLEEIKDKPDK